MSDLQSRRMLRVLQLEDSVLDRAVIQEILLAAGVACEFQWVETRSEFEAQIKLIEFDLILSDYTLPAYDGDAALAFAQQFQPNAPFIFVSGTIGEERAVASLRGGATDYVLKQNLDRLVPAVKRAIREAKEREKRHEAEIALRKAEEKYRTIFENAHEGIYQRTPDGQFLSANPAMATILGYDSPESLIREGWDGHAAIQTGGARADEFRQRMSTTGSVSAFEYSTHRRDGATVWVSENARAVRDSEGNIAYYEGTLTDITERKKSEADIQNSLKEKEVLLKEIHHRVKNNLQIISSLLSLQSGDIQEPAVLEIFKESQRRIFSMVLIHESLYGAKDLARVNFREYAGKLTADLFRSFGADPWNIRMEINVPEVFLSIDTCVPCGLIINELVSNSLKYAFPQGRSGTIVLELKLHDDGGFLLAIRDNGVGFKQNPDFAKTTSLGIKLVSSLTRQLGATINFERTEWSEFRINVPAVPNFQ